MVVRADHRTWLHESLTRFVIYMLEHSLNRPCSFHSHPESLSGLKTESNGHGSFFFEFGDKIWQTRSIGQHQKCCRGKILTLRI